MNLDPSEDRDLKRIQQAIRDLPELEPPDLLLRSVMHAVKTRELPIWTRLLRWSKAPRSVTFTPLRLVPAAALLIVVCLGGVFHLIRDEKDRLALKDSRVPVVLAYRSPDARSVAVIGSFNGWQAQKCELKSINGEPHWSVTLLLPTGRYEYAFVVDGDKIVPDPGAGLHEEDGFGNQNAILFVGNGNGNSV
jgi:hypothetical protein